MSARATPERPILTVSFSLSGCPIVVKGWDELYLQRLCNAICNDGQEVFDGEPQVIRLETIRKSAEGEGKYFRQAGGVGNYGHVKLLLEPMQESKGLEILRSTPENLLPDAYARAAQAGIWEAALGGVVAGHEVVGLKATLIGGSVHELDSNPMAFRIAGSMAFKEAARKASPVVLEPMMSVELTVNLLNAAETVSELNAREARIEGMAPQGALLEIRATVPLREMLGSSKYGRPDYPMEFARYEAVRQPPGAPGEDGLGVTADSPKSPNLRRRSAAVLPENDWQNT